MTLRTVQTDRDDVLKLWEATKEETREVRSLSVGARALSHTITATGASTVITDHKLGRQPVGWVVTDRTTAVTVYRSAWDTHSISLVFSGAGVVDVLVY